MRRLITTGSPMEREAGYSRAVVQGGPGGEWCFVSGTTGYDYATMELPGSVEEQARNALATIATTLAEAGFAMAHVVRCQYIVSERAFVARVFPILGEAFGEIRPAATMVVAGLIDERLLVEIEVTAFKG